MRSKTFALLSSDILKWHIRDLAYRFAPKPASLVFYIASLVVAILKYKTCAYTLLMRAHRYYPSDFLSKRIKSRLDDIQINMPSLIGPPVNVEMAACRSIFLKLPKFKGNKFERGILLITFTDTFRYYFYHVDLDLLSKYFDIVLEPSWAGYCLPEILFWCKLPGPVIVESTEVTDRRFLEILDTNLKHVDFGASDWVDYRIFRPLELPKKYDSIYVANYTPIKRVHVFFRALKEIKRTKTNYRAALLCASWGNQRSVVMKLMDVYDVKDMLDIYEDESFEGVNELLNRSKVNVLLSLKEGSNRSLFETMFAGTPVIALKNNIGINKSYINDETGELVKECDLATVLLQFKQSHANYRPREWAIDHISPEVTTKKLLHTLQLLDTEQVHSRDDVLIKVNNPEVSYFSQSLTLADNEKRAKFNLVLLNCFSSDDMNEEKLITFLKDISIV